MKILKITQKNSLYRFQQNIDVFSKKFHYQSILYNILELFMKNCIILWHSGRDKVLSGFRVDFRITEISAKLQLLAIILEQIHLQRNVSIVHRRTSRA